MKYTQICTECHYPLKSFIVATKMTPQSRLFKNVLSYKIE